MDSTAIKNADERALLKEHHVSSSFARLCRETFTHNKDRDCTYASILKSLISGELPEGLSLFNGRYFNIRDFGTLGYAMQSAANLSQAAQLAMRYYHTAEPLLGIRLRIETDGVYFVMSNDYQLSDIAYRLVIEEILSLFPALLRSLTGQTIEPTLIRLTFARPSYAALYRESLGHAPEFACEESCYGIPKHALDLELQNSDASTFALLDARCQELLQIMAGQQSLANRIRGLFLQRFLAHYTAKGACRSLNMSERSMRRKLLQEGVSFRELLEDVRSRLAKDYLCSTRLSSQEIAELLGYSETANFRRAFKRWTKRSPEQYRNSDASMRNESACRTTHKSIVE